MLAQLEKEEEYNLNLLKLRSNHQRQHWRIVYIESAEDGKLEGRRNRSLIPETLRIIMTESRKQIQLAETLLLQVQAL